MSTAGVSMAVFWAMVGLDFAWARYTGHLSAGRRLWAAGYSAVLTALSYGMVLIYTANPVYVLPMCAGAFLGTWLGTAPKGPPPGVDVGPT